MSNVRPRKRKVPVHRQRLNSSMKLLALLIALAVGVCSPHAEAEEVPFTGRTSANVHLIKDVLQDIQLIGRGALSCDSITSVRSILLPSDYRPSGGPFPEGRSRTIYERWQVELCGTKEDFLVAFWAPPAGEEGVVFRVAHPFHR